ncbi:MAG: hypothetical protein Q9227_003938 [Pyrenula ochraceoflavens]
MFYTTATLALILGATFKGASAQVSTTCNPLTTKDCPADPALGGTFQWDFTGGQSTSFYTDSWWLPFINYDKTNGATFSITRKGIAPTLTSKFYVMYGRFEVAIKTAAGQGIVSDVILQSDDQDEVDLEWVGGQGTQVQTNYYSLRNRDPVYNQGFTKDIGSNLQSDFHTYTVDWTADRLIFGVDGKPIRTVNSTDDDQYPRTPMKITMGLWAGGDSANAQGTIDWAGGVTDYSKGPFNMSIKSVKVVDYSTGDSYTYSDQTGSADSIKAKNGNINPHGTAAADKMVTSVFTDAGSALTTSATSSSSAVVSHTEGSQTASSTAAASNSAAAPASSTAGSSSTASATSSAAAASDSAIMDCSSDGNCPVGDLVRSANPTTPAGSGTPTGRDAPVVSTCQYIPCRVAEGASNPSCNQNYVAGKGTYKMNCDTDSYSSDICFFTQAKSLAECILQCDLNSKYNCIGVVYKNSSKQCYLKSNEGTVYKQPGSVYAKLVR